ncbi:MAG: hypothetical protein G01um101466_699 [Parcubacteria group bacterium Gr01-1014_66]|nr:MAG: hypothetical protein G01um101466_699 [Parcubacteria group bacterium Gr01-1014_66]
MIGLTFRGRPPIKLADTVKEVVLLKNEYAAAIMDRNMRIDEGFVAAIMGQSLMTWEGRNPGPALDSDGNFQGTDLDLLSFLMPIADRKAVIEIPRYRNRRKIVRRANERKIGSNQFGAVTGLASHKDALSFSIRLYDQTIVRRDPATHRERTGAFRNYMIVDCDGHWYDGWDRICWSPTAEENRFLSEKSLWTDNSVIFKYYVHPNRWQSVFGAPYFLQKMLLERIDDEAQFYRSEVKRLQSMDILFPSEQGGSFYTPPVSEGETKPISVQTIEMILDIPEFLGAYTPMEENSKGLQNAYSRQKFLTYTLKPFIQFCTRANEAAYYHFGQGQVASWMQGRTWVEWKPSKGRTQWHMMRLGVDMALRYRIRIMTQQVSAE